MEGERLRGEGERLRGEGERPNGGWKEEGRKGEDRYSSQLNPGFCDSPLSLQENFRFYLLKHKKLSKQEL